MKVVAYLRVSTDRQAEHGLGLDVQREAIRAWSKVNKHRVIAWCSDEGVSGSNGLDTREALADALAALSTGEAAALVVYRLDRLARDLVLQEHLLVEIRRMGADVFSTSSGEDAYLTDDPDDPSRKLIRQVLGAVAEYERAMIRLRLKAGRRRKHENGGYAYGSPPYGYRADNGELVPVAEEQTALKLMQQLRDDGNSLRNIGEALEDAGYRPRKANSWAPNVIATILDRSAD
jgi:DNA invertase Pin-like site-specific DNA recombinase